MTGHRVTLFGILLACAEIAAARVTYYHSDALGSPVVATGENGAVLWRAHYRPFGDRDQNAADYLASLPNRLWYTGHVHDDQIGLTYMQARYYSPVLGRFFSTDSAAYRAEDPVSFNRYAYARNNPYRYIDPDGEDAVVFAFKGTAIAGAGVSGGVGVYLTYPGADDVPYDLGLFSTLAAGTGADASLTANVYLLPGGRENIEGEFVAASSTLPLTGLIGPAVDAEILVNPATQKFSGSGLGLGFAAFPGASATIGQSTIDFSLRDAFINAPGQVESSTNEGDSLDAESSMYDLWYFHISN